ncbi:MAG TPA: ATP-binding protein [Acidimicrobiia bacterium]|nr:ATP-binding protein [Acidimicrobiia bacterium]
MSDISEVLRGLPYFTDLPDDLLERVSRSTELIEVPADTVIIDEGSESGEMYVVVSGELSVSKHSASKDVELARIGPGEVVGEIALLDEAPRTATVTALIDSAVIRVPVAAFEDLLSDPRVVRRMFRTVTSRLRGIEDTLRHEERMAALGRMAAQLMHELNNPAAAVARSTSELSKLHGELDREVEALATGYDNPTVLATVEKPERPLSALERSAAEDELASWLEEIGVEDPWQIAPALVEAGWRVETLKEVVANSPDELKAHEVRWIGLILATRQVMSELVIAARRVSELVRVVKEYSFVDRAPVQEIDPTDGIRDTLILLKHKLADIEVELDFEEPVPRLEVPGRDLNQVWTNLIDNAADAMAETGGTLTIASRNMDDSLVVTFSDTGQGIPEHVTARIFDPFFTTKEPGKGTGLGLHTVHTILNRIGGSIDLTTGATGTTFQVTLPRSGR